MERNAWFVSAYISDIYGPVSVNLRQASKLTLSELGQTPTFHAAKSRDFDAAAEICPLNCMHNLLPP
jgi:hypothetical protein